MTKRIAIIGAGPTGLGAAYRLSELGYDNWDIYEKNPYIGGLAASFRDENGFTWDIGLHVIFSDIAYFNKAVDVALGRDYYKHFRRSFIYTGGRRIPYPFQNNIKYLEPHQMLECIEGLRKIHKMKTKKAGNFEEWINNTFGAGIAKYFMVPYNKKAWKHRLSDMSYDWIGRRVSVINIEKILDNIINDKDDVSWGLHNSFKYPIRGGIGQIYSRIGKALKRQPHLNKEVSGIDINKRIITFKSGDSTGYDRLINTGSLDTLILKILNVKNGRLSKLARELKHTKAFIVGIGFKGSPASEPYWAYFPEDKIPFYRMIYSTYSPNNVPKKDTHSIVCEVSMKSLNKDPKDVARGAIEGLVRAGVITPKDRKKVISQYIIALDRSYPIPTLTRDRALEGLQSFLRSHDIYSRGRFGAWKYEVGNMDHSFMQGVEAADNILFSKKERTIT